MIFHLKSAEKFLRIRCASLKLVLFIDSGVHGMEPVLKVHALLLNGLLHSICLADSAIEFIDIAEEDPLVGMFLLQSLQSLRVFPLKIKVWHLEIRDRFLRRLRLIVFQDSEINRAKEIQLVCIL